jgi:aconitate hydratase
MSHNLFNTLQSFDLGNGQQGQFYSLPQLEKEGVGPVSKLPISIRVVLESVLRNYDEQKSAKPMCASWPTGAPTQNAPKKSPSWSRESCCKTSPACRC